MGARERRGRREALRLGRDLVEIFAEDGGIDDDLAVMVEGGKRRRWD